MSHPTPEDEKEWLENCVEFPPRPEAGKEVEEDGADPAESRAGDWRRRALVAEETLRRVVELARAV